MKKAVKTIALMLILVLSLTACASGVNKEGLFKDATYTKDTTLGEGKKTVLLEVKVEDTSLMFTVKTNKEMLGEALLDENLIEGEEGAYGLYIKKVNGILADYDTDKSYWAFYINNQLATSGVDTTKIEEGAAYKLEYTK